MAELQAIFEVLAHRFVRLRQWLGGLLDELGMVERILRAFIQVQSLTATSDLEEGITLLLKLISEFQNILYDLAAFPALAEILRSQVTQRLSALITLRNRVAKIDPRSSKGGVELEPPAFTSQLASLRKSPAMHPGSPLRLSRHTGGLYRYDGDLAPHLLTALDQRLTQAYSAWGSATVPVHPLKEGARMQAAAAMRLHIAVLGCRSSS